MKVAGTMVFILPLAACFCFFSCAEKKADENVKIFPDSVLADVSQHPVGINLDYFMDGDRYPNPSRSVTDALREMGVKYLRYPGGG